MADELSEHGPMDSITSVAVLERERMGELCVATCERVADPRVLSVTGRPGVLIYMGFPWGDG